MCICLTTCGTHTNAQNTHAYSNNSNNNNNNTGRAQHNLILLFTLFIFTSRVTYKNIFISSFSGFNHVATKQQHCTDKITESTEIPAPPVSYYCLKSAWFLQMCIAIMRSVLSYIFVSDRWLVWMCVQTGPVCVWYFFDTYLNIFFIIIIFIFYTCAHNSLHSAQHYIINKQGKMR